MEHFSGEVKRNVQKHIVNLQPKGSPFAISFLMGTGVKTMKNLEMQSFVTGRF